MDFVNSYFTIVIILVLIAAVSLSIVSWRKSVALDRRIESMMLSCGIDKDAIANAQLCLNIDMNAVRARCRNCPVTHLCDRWLDGEALASNNFCPNAWVFLKAADSGQS